MIGQTSITPINLNKLRENRNSQIGDVPTFEELPSAKIQTLDSYYRVSTVQHPATGTFLKPVSMIKKNNLKLRKEISYNRSINSGN